MWPEGNSIAWLIIQFMRLSNGISRAREPGASAALSRVAQPLPVPPPRPAAAQTSSPRSGALHLQRSPLVLPADWHHPQRAADLLGESQQTGATSATHYGDKDHGDARVPPAPQNHPGFALLVTEQSSLRDPHPTRVPAGFPERDPEAGERARPRAGDSTRRLAASDAACSVPTLRHTNAAHPGSAETGSSPCRAGGGCVPRRGLCRGEQRGWQWHAAPLHQAAVRGNFCSSTTLPVSSLRANFNHRVAVVRVKNLTLL